MQVAKKEIATDLIYENKNIVAFRDINPQAPVHILLIPKLHFSTLNDLMSNDKYLVGNLIYSAAKLAKREGIAEQGYRTVFNCNEWEGQTVYHIHLFCWVVENLDGHPVKVLFINFTFVIYLMKIILISFFCEF